MELPGRGFHSGFEITIQPFNHITTITPDFTATIKQWQKI